MEFYKCPLIGDKIESYDCFVMQTAAEGIAPRSYLPNKQDIEKERQICMECKHHEKL